MSSGSFDSQLTGLDFESEIEIRSIKTPNQLPDRIDLTQVPENILRSGVIESLINQNDDLMSRLTVALRRVASLEEKIADSQLEANQFKTKYDNLKDQVLVLREQSRLVAERARSTEEKYKREDQSLGDLKEQIHILEIRYAELYTSTQEKQAELLAKIEIQRDFIEKFTRRYTKYRQNMRRAVFSTKNELHSLRAKRHGQETILSDLRKNISESTSYISEQSKEHKNQILNLTNAYEDQLRGFKNKIDTLDGQNRILTERSLDFEKTINEKVKLENALIISERRFEEIQIHSAAEVSDIQKTLARYRNDAKSLAIELESQTVAYTKQTLALESLSEENHGLNEQVETLQALWRDQQNQVEKITDQKNSLQKLNKELSIAINEYRREMRELKDRLDATELKSISFKNEVEKKEKMRSELDCKVGTHSSPQEVKPEVAREDSLTPELISKIDKALSGLHAEL